MRHDLEAKELAVIQPTIPVSAHAGGEKGKKRSKNRDQPNPYEAPLCHETKLPLSGVLAFFRVSHLARQCLAAVLCLHSHCRRRQYVPAPNRREALSPVGGVQSNAGGCSAA